MAVQPDDIQDELQYRERLLTALTAHDDKIRTIFDKDFSEHPLTLDSMPAMVNFREALHATKDTYEKNEKSVGLWLTGALKAGGIPKWESTSHIVQIMTPPDRVSVDPDTLKAELALLGVPVEKITAAIEKATKRTPVASFVRVDKRRSAR